MIVFSIVLTQILVTKQFHKYIYFFFHCIDLYIYIYKSKCNMTQQPKDAGLHSQTPSSPLPTKTMNVLADPQELFYRSCSSRPFELCLWVEDGRGRGDQGDKSCHPNLSERLVLCGFIPLRVRESAMLSKHISGHLMAQWALLGWALLVNTTVPSAGPAQNRIISPSRFLSGQSLASRRLSHGQGGLALIPGQCGWVTEG